MPYSFLAEVVLILHFALVSFVIFSVFLIWAGYFLRWKFVRNFWFRITHLLVMACVLAQTWFHLMCPLTVWENQLRVRAGQGIRYEYSCIEYWLHRTMFFDLPSWVFQIAYSLFFLLIILSVVVVRPAWPRKH